MPYASLWDRLVANIRIEGDCWTWTGPVRRHRGGDRPAISMRVPGGGRRTHPKNYNAARVMVELIHGPIPEGYEASHLCRDNWLCICPDHVLAEPKDVNLSRRDGTHEDCDPDPWAGEPATECPF